MWRMRPEPLEEPIRKVGYSLLVTGDVTVVCILDPPRKRVDSKCASSPQLQLQRARCVEGVQ